MQRESEYPQGSRLQHLPAAHWTCDGPAPTWMWYLFCSSPDTAVPDFCSLDSCLLLQQHPENLCMQRDFLGHLTASSP